MIYRPGLFQSSGVACGWAAVAVAVLAPLAPGAVAAPPSRFEYTFEDQPLGQADAHKFAPKPDTVGNGYVNPHNGHIVADPDDPDNHVLRVRYAKGAVSHTQDSGMRIRTPIQPGEAYWMSYRVRFADDFDWRAGGKLPGLTGGKPAWGGKDARGDGWSVRQMWVKDGRLIPYLYHMDRPEAWGDPLGPSQDKFRFEQGRWHHLALYVQVNTDDNKDGKYKLFLDGELVRERDDIRYRNRGRAPIDMLYIDSFFGGNSDAYRPFKDEFIYFDDVRLSTNRGFVFETLPEPKG